MDMQDKDLRRGLALVGEVRAHDWVSSSGTVRSRVPRLAGAADWDEVEWYNACDYETFYDMLLDESGRVLRVQVSWCRGEDVVVSLWLFEDGGSVPVCESGTAVGDVVLSELFGAGWRESARVVAAEFEERFAVGDWDD